MLIGGDFEAGILSQPTGKVPEGARQPRLIVLASHRKDREHSHYPHAYGVRSIMGVR
jgi:hypothetical protein